MGCCSALNCSNRPEKGFRLFRFPGDKQVRAKWVANCKRENWEPGVNSRICEVHFTKIQFEQNRQDGKKLLRWDAVPTIFDDPDLKVTTKKRKKGHDKDYTKRCKREGEENETTSTSSQSTQTDPLADDVELNEALQNSGLVKDGSSREKILEGKALLLKRTCMLLRKKLNVAQNELQTMKRKVSAFLNEDQIESLHKKRMPWSEATITAALQLRYSLGDKGYLHLLQIGYPLPSYQTLCRHVRNATIVPASSSPKKIMVMVKKIN